MTNPTSTHSSLPSYSESESQAEIQLSQRSASLQKQYLTDVEEGDEQSEGDRLLSSQPYSDQPTTYIDEGDEEEELRNFLAQRRERIYQETRARRRRRCHACHVCCASSIVAPSVLVLLYLWIFLPLWPFTYFVKDGMGDASLNVVGGEFPDKVESILGSEVPGYVLKYAPVVYLHPKERFYPSDLAVQLDSTVPRFANWSRVTQAPSPLTLDNLADLNAYNDGDIYLSTKHGIQFDQGWFHGVQPNTETGATDGARSTTIVIVDKGNGIVDAFYLYFYAYNKGSGIWGVQFGDHVGDWEQNMIRFKDGEPYAVWYSQHSNGEAFLYEALEKEADGVRPVTYAALGTHANYATPGKHDHTLQNHRLPYGIINDYTSRDGLRWDPTLSFYAYKYNPHLAPSDEQSFTPLPSIPEETNYDNHGNVSLVLPPTSWITFQGKWGDNKYPWDARGQYDFFGEWRYIPGPGGPGVPRKNLGRRSMCRDEGRRCIVWDRR